MERSILRLSSGTLWRQQMKRRGVTSIQQSSLSRPSQTTFQTTLRRDMGISTFPSWVRDVVRTGSLRPPNPLLTSINKTDFLESSQELDDDHQYNPSTTFTPPTKEPSETPQQVEFPSMLPYHLESAASEVRQQYMVDLAELEVSLTSFHADHTKATLLQRLDELEAPVTQILQIGRLYCDWASPPDQLPAWKKAYATAQRTAAKLPWRQSKIVYQNLPKDDPRFSDLRLAYQSKGAHIEDQDKIDELKEVAKAVQSVQGRLDAMPPFEKMLKNQRVQLLSDLYNWIGYSQLQAQKMGLDNVAALRYPANVAQPDEILNDVAPAVTKLLRPHLPKKSVKLDSDVGVLLGAEGPAAMPQRMSSEQRELFRTKWLVQKLMNLHGVLQGMSDFWDAMFGIRVEYEANAGWNPNVRLLHLYDADTDEPLGSIYLDPFKDRYWRCSDAASELVHSRLFSQRASQTQVPVAVVTLKITPTWDDVPTPMSWDDTRELLYHMGKALQKILSQSKATPGTEPPKDVSEFMATFMEMWIHNDGFLQRLAQLSQDEHVFDEPMLEALRKDHKQKKITDLMEHTFRGCLELAMWTEFDPRGEESLDMFQNRIAESYLPHQTLESSDFSYLLQVAQGENDESAYGPLYSEVLAAMAYDKFQTTDLRDRQEVKRLGRGIRDLFLRESNATKEDFEALCGGPIDVGAVQRVYKF